MAKVNLRSVREADVALMVLDMVSVRVADAKSRKEIVEIVDGFKAAAQVKKEQLVEARKPLQFKDESLRTVKCRKQLCKATGQVARTEVAGWACSEAHKA